MLDPARVEAIGREIAAMKQAQQVVYGLGLKAEAHEFQVWSALLSSYVDVAEEALAAGLDYVEDAVEVPAYRARYIGEKLGRLFGGWLRTPDARRLFLEQLGLSPPPGPRSYQPRVVIESPYQGEVERNVRYARAAVNDAIGHGEAPYASHLFYTQPGILDDTDPEQRRLGIDLGLIWGEAAERTVVYTDLGITPGMKLGIERAVFAGRPIEHRCVAGWR